MNESNVEYILDYPTKATPDFFAGRNDLFGWQDESVPRIRAWKFQGGASSIKNLPEKFSK